MDEQHLQFFLRDAPVAAAMFDRNMRYLVASGRWLEDYRLDSNVIGRSHYEIFPEISERWKEVHRRTLRGETLKGEEDHFECPDGTVQWLRWEARPWYAADGEIGGIVIFSEEVTEQKQAKERARSNELRLGLALDAASMISFDWDVPSDEVHRFEMTDAGSPPQVEASRNFVGVCEAVHPDDRERFRADVHAALTSKNGRYESEIRVVRPDGEIAWFLERGRVERDVNGRPARLIGVAQDITERKRAEDALRDADRRKDEFIAILSHELRNPLAPIRNGLQVLCKTGGQGPSAERAREMMERQVEHLVRLVDDLLDVSRVTHGKIELRKERLDLGVLVRTVDLNREQVDAAGILLRLNLPDKPVLVEADPVRLAQIFSNLVNNAVKYTDRGGQIEVAVQREADEAVVSVADTGAGIPKDILPHVFDLFVQVKRSPVRTQGGLGIGLSLVRGLVELHDGNVEAHSEGEGRGSRFVVRLPLSGTVEANASPPQAATYTTVPPRRVLVVDDTRDVADSFALLLEILGAQVRVAYSGAQALAACAEFEPELVFLDIGMPQMDGFETARRMRKLPAGREPVFIALTGWGEEETRRRAREAGFDRFLTKPADMSELEALLLDVTCGKDCQGIFDEA